VDYDSDLHEPRTNAEQSRTRHEFRVSYESLDHLYFFRAGDGPVKIGRAKDPVKRLKQCQTGSHDKLQMLAVLECRGFEEKIWHRAFCETRIRGEWFLFDEELGRAIDLAKQGKPWWDYLDPPLSYPMSDDPEEWDDDCVDWQILVQLNVAEAAEKVGIPPHLAGRNIYQQDNEPRQHTSGE
jgi:hypothetical protein